MGCEMKTARTLAHSSCFYVSLLSIDGWSIDLEFIAEVMNTYTHTSEREKTERERHEQRKQRRKSQRRESNK
jgi:hypothetical protein